MEARPRVYTVCDTLAHTLNTHKKIEDATWHFPDDLVHNLIDFILMPRCFKSNINKTKTWIYPGASDRTTNEEETNPGSRSLGLKEGIEERKEKQP